MQKCSLLAVLLILSTGFAPQKQEHPGYPPTVFLASAMKEADQVIVQMSRCGPVPPPADGKIPPDDQWPTEWVPLRKVTLGETVQAFGIDGKPMEPQAVLKALAKPRGVAVFIRSYANDPRTPPEFYRNLFREGTPLLVVNADDIYNPKP